MTATIQTALRRRKYGRICTILATDMQASAYKRSGGSWIEGSWAGYKCGQICTILATNMCWRRPTRGLENPGLMAPGRSH